MLDPGRYLAEAIYFVQYALAQILWAADRALLSIAVIAESVDGWFTDNIGYFVELLVNALSAPLGGLLILALTALGFWYALNTIVATGRWVDPSRLFTYGLIALFFFSSPLVAVNLMEELRTALAAGVDQALVDGASGDIFDTSMDGTDAGLPGAIPDVNGDGVVGSFDMAAAFMGVANIDELDSGEFPLDFEAQFFPFGDPSSIDLSDEADQELAKALAARGIERLVFALIAVPTAIAEHFLRLSLTGVAVLLYAGVPFAMLFAFFVYTQAFLVAYLKQFVNLLVETFMSVVIAGMMVGLLAAAALQGVGLYIGASIITFIVLLWRIKSALRLAAAAFDLFGGALITGGAGGMELTAMGRQAALGGVGLAGAALTGGATAALGTAVVGAAAALQADGRRDGTVLGTDPEKTEGRVAQLKTVAGYTFGRSEALRGVIEGAHEVRTLSRNFRDGQVQAHAPDTLDYLRAGSSMSGFGSSPWLAMRLSPSLRAAYDDIGGRRVYDNVHPLAYDEEGAPVSVADTGADAPRPATRQQLLDQFAHLQQALAGLTAALSASGDPARGVREWAERPGDGPVVLFTPGEEPAAGTTGGRPPERDVRDARVVERAPNPAAGSGQALDQARTERSERDGREDEYETTGRGQRGAGSIHLQPYEPAREEALVETLSRLEEPASPAGQAAYRSLATHAGRRNADLIRGAAATHGAPSVQEAATATAALAGRYRREGLGDAAILDAFRRDEAASTLREMMETPLSDEQLAAVADLILQPRRRVTRSELAAVAGERVAAGDVTVEAVQRAIGSPVHFGGQTGNVRGVIAGAERMGLAPDEMARLADLIRDGLWQEAQQALLDRGHRPAVVHTFIADLGALPAEISVPQTTAPGDREANEENGEETS